MKVIEKGTDRKAEVHVYLEGKVNALPEYGEYIDPKDKAICCYIPVDEGHQLKFGGRFSGTTLTVAYDASVDGVIRKASSYVGKTVNLQSNKKLDVEDFLYKTDQGIIDTQIVVTPLKGETTTRNDAPETIGTLEMRLYVTRQLDVFHTIENVEKYYTTKCNIEDGDAETEQYANYKVLPPTFQTTFEKNCAPLERRKVTQWQRRMAAERPGSKPWAIFRFHYRSKDAITEREMTMTFDPSSKEKTEPHGLIHDPVPPLLVGTKPQKKDDEDTSTRAGSPMPPSTPSTPAKVAQSTPKTSTPTKNPRRLAKPKTTTTMTITTEKAPATISETSTNSTPEGTPSPESHENGIEDLRAKLFSKPAGKPTAMEKPAREAEKITANGDADSVISTSTVNGSSDMPTEQPVRKSIERCNEKPTDKATETDSITVNGRNTAAVLKNDSSGSTENIAARAFSLPDQSSKPPNGTAEKSPIAAKETVQRSSQAPATLSKTPIMRPTPITSAATTAQKKPTTPATATTPAKRPTAPTNGSTPDPKRSKIVSGPMGQTIQPLVPRIPPRSPTPKTVSIERQLTEQRQKVADMRKKRLEIAKKQEAIDQQMTPYKQRMAEELERLNQEMMDEERACTEEEQHYSASVDILQEFRKADGGGD